MPTSPNLNVIDRALSVTSIAELAGIGSSILTESVNYSSHVLIRCSTSKFVTEEKEKDTDTAPLALFRLLIELADGMEELLKLSIGNPAIAIIRSMFEALISLEYILETNQNYESRSIAWTVGYAMQRLASHKQFDPSTVQGKQFVENWKKDSATKNIELPDSEMVQDAISNMENFLSKPHITETYRKIRELKKVNRMAYWFSIDNGPANLFKLSNHLSRGGQYNLQYRQWSGIVHASDLLAFLAPRNKKGQGGIKGLRDAKEVKNLYINTIGYLITSTKKMLAKFRPGEETSFAKWYKENIQANFHKLVELNVETTYIE